MAKRRSGLNPIEKMVRAKRRVTNQKEYLKQMAAEYAGAAAEAVKRLDDYGTTRLPSASIATGGASVYGSGRYSLGKLSRTAAGKKIGRALIKRVAGAIGGSGMYTGRGAYIGNSLMSDRPPQVMSSAADETGTVTVSRLEFLTEIYGPGSPGAAVPFNVQSFPLNPALEKTFPWLSQIAQNYEEYEFEQLIFSFRSTTTDIGSSTTGQCGTVLMATAYDASAAVFGDKMEMMAYDGAMSCKTTESMMHGVECDPEKLSGSKGKYTRAFGLSPDKDVKDYDHGLFQLAIANIPNAYASNSLGELWVSYTVKLRKPKFFGSRGLNISRDVYVSNGSESVNAPIGPQANVLRAICNNIGTKLVMTTGKVAIYFPADFAGVVEVNIKCEGSSGLDTTNWSLVPNANANIVAYSDIYGATDIPATDSPTYFAFAKNATTYIFIARFRISPATSGYDNILNWNVVTAGTPAILQTSMEINEINSGFSYKYANMGTSDAPVLVNAQGQVVAV